MVKKIIAEEISQEELERLMDGVKDGQNKKTILVTEDDFEDNDEIPEAVKKVIREHIAETRAESESSEPKTDPKQPEYTARDIIEEIKDTMALEGVDDPRNVSKAAQKRIMKMSQTLKKDKSMDRALEVLKSLIPEDVKDKIIDDLKQEMFGKRAKRNKYIVAEMMAKDKEAKKDNGDTWIDADKISPEEIKDFKECFSNHLIDFVDEIMKSAVTHAMEHHKFDQTSALLAVLQMGPAFLSTIGFTWSSTMFNEHIRLKDGSPAKAIEAHSEFIDNMYSEALKGLRSSYEDDIKRRGGGST